MTESLPRSTSIPPAASYPFHLLPSLLASLFLALACSHGAGHPKPAAEGEAPRIPTPRMAMVVTLGDDPRGWHAQRTDASPLGFLVEFVPKGDVIESWSELFTQQIVFAPITVDDAVRQFASQLQQTDPAVKIRAEPQEDGSIILKHGTKVADEISVRRFFRGPDGIYMVAYYARPSRPGMQAHYEIWKGIIAKTRLVPNPKAAR